MSAAAAVRVVGVSRRLGGGSGFQLVGIDADVEPGGWLAITGRSGSGKTTLLQLMATLARPDAGEVWIFGEPVHQAGDPRLAALRREHIGVVYQTPVFLERLPVWQNVTARWIPAGVESKQRRARAAEALTRFELGHLLDRRPNSLSGGERQRVALARAVVHAPALLFADEPTSNVDAESAAGIRAELERLRAAGTAVVVSTHDPTLVTPADRELRLARGEALP